MLIECLLAQKLSAFRLTPCRYDSRAKSGECRGDTAGRSANKQEAGWTVIPRKLSGITTGRRQTKHLKNGDRARMAAKRTLAFAVARLQSRHGVSRQRLRITTFAKPPLCGGSADKAERATRHTHRNTARAGCPAGHNKKPGISPVSSSLSAMPLTFLHLPLTGKAAQTRRCPPPRRVPPDGPTRAQSCAQPGKGPLRRQLPAG